MTFLLLIVAFVIAALVGFGMLVTLVMFNWYTFTYRRDVHRERFWLEIQDRPGRFQEITEMLICIPAIVLIGIFDLVAWVTGKLFRRPKQKTA